MAVYVPSRYMNKITRRAKARRRNPCSMIDFELEVNFPTWEEAREWLVNMRRSDLKCAEDSAESARRRLKAALNMRDADIGKPLEK